MAPQLNRKKIRLHSKQQAEEIPLMIDLKIRPHSIYMAATAAASVDDG